MADEGNFVALDSGVDDGEGAGAGGALQVFELVDGDAGSRRELERRGVLEVVSAAGWNGFLGGRGERERKEDGGGGESGAGGVAEHGCETHKVYECHFSWKLGE